MPTFWCDGESSFCIVEFGSEIWNLNKATQITSNHFYTFFLLYICIRNSALLFIIPTSFHLYSRIDTRAYMSAQLDQFFQVRKDWKLWQWIVEQFFSILQKKLDS
jgi:hypothetical protein